MRILLILALALSTVFGIACGTESTQPASDADKSTEATETTDSKDEAKDESKEGAKSGEASADKNIVENASALEDFSTLVTAVKAAGLVETLSGEGPFTIFAPTNDAFKKLPEGTLDTLLKEENKDKLKGILTYHVVSGKLDSAAVKKAIEEGNGKATLKTVQGNELTASIDGDKVVITDATGGKSTVTAVDTMNKNGVIHVIDTVIMPSK